MIVRILIRGEPASKANSRRIVMFGKRPASIKSEKARDYERAAALQVRTLPRLLEGPLRVSMWILYSTERPDLDPSLILDVLQGRVYANDRQVREMHLYHAIDRHNPRAEIVIETMAPQQTEIDVTFDPLSREALA
jgi:Holliday junction resolvase RusA-like endonuclease